MKPKVLFIIPNLDRGGSEKVFTTILCHINPDKTDITAAVVTRQGFYFDQLPEHTNKVFLDVWRVKYSLGKLRRLIRDIKPDIVFTFNVNHLNLIAVPAVLMQRRTIQLITRESSILSVVNAKKGRLAPFVDWVYRQLYKKVDHIICQSDFMQQDLVKHFKVQPAQAVIINNPVPYDEIRKKALSEKFLLKSGCYNLVSVGRLTHVKGFDLLLQALSYVKVNYHLTLVGGETYEHPEYKEYLLNLITQNNLSDKISFEGFRANPYPYMQQADILILPSRYEGFPNVALEAMALGTPVIAFSSGGQNDLIKNDFNGWLVPLADVEQLGKAINESYERKLDKKAIAQYVKDNFDVVQVISAYETFLSSLYK